MIWLKLYNNSIWIFHGEHGRFASGVFNSLDLAEEWIKKHQLSGILTQYPINEGIYDWAIENKTFEIKREDQKSAKFIQQFSSASQERYHYESGERE